MKKNIYQKTPQGQFRWNLDRFLGEKSNNVSTGTFTKYKTWRNNFLEYESLVENFQWTEQNLTQEHLVGYREFLKNIKHNKPDTVTKSIKCLKNFLKEMYPDVKVDYLNVPQTPRKPISLTEIELKQLQYLGLSGTEAEIRDIFVLLCLTGMEFNDFVFYEWDLEARIIAYKTHRRKRDAVLPISEDAKKLIQKYKGCFPRHGSTLINKKLKVIFREHDFNRLVTDKMDCQEPSNPLHEKVTISVAKHTFIQHQINAGVGGINIMKMCGIENIEKLSYYNYPELDDPEKLAEYLKKKLNM
ncbi:MAG: phage integrase SAM-like domain-containing protein [Candidatus Cloacimonadales bacterium]|nr:phage integrase SAM-like domain-containing protein [Bacteroidales bacterium]